MNRFRIYHAASLESLVEQINGIQSMFSTVVYFGPTIPKEKGDNACMAILDFSCTPVITHEEILIMQSPPTLDIEMDEYKEVLSA